MGFIYLHPISLLSPKSGSSNFSLVDSLSGCRISMPNMTSPFNQCQLQSKKAQIPGSNQDNLVRYVYTIAPQTTLLRDMAWGHTIFTLFSSYFMSFNKVSQFFHEGLIKLLLALFGGLESLILCFKYRGVLLCFICWCSIQKPFSFITLALTSCLYFKQF